MTKQEMVVSALRELGYNPQTDNDGDVFICYQMKHFYVMGTQDEENYLTVLFPQFYSISEGDETKVLAACNKVTRDIKMAKVYVDQTLANVTASCEFYYDGEDSLKVCLGKSVEILGFVRSSLFNTIREFGQ